MDRIIHLANKKGNPKVPLAARSYGKDVLCDHSIRTTSSPRLPVSSQQQDGPCNGRIRGRPGASGPLLRSWGIRWCQGFSVNRATVPSSAWSWCGKSYFLELPSLSPPFPGTWSLSRFINPASTSNRGSAWPEEQLHFTLFMLTPHQGHNPRQFSEHRLFSGRVRISNSHAWHETSSSVSRESTSTTSSSDPSAGSAPSLHSGNGL